MKLTTPVNGIKNGEMYTIRDVYVKMINESAVKASEDALFKKVYETIKTKDFEKLTRFAAKNRTLCESATRKAIISACDGIECDGSTLDCVCSKVKKAIDCDLAPYSAKCTKFGTPKVKTMKRVSEAGKSLDDLLANKGMALDKDEPVYHDDDELTPSDLEEIERLTKDIDNGEEDDGKKKKAKRGRKPKDVKGEDDDTIIDREAEDDDRSKLKSGKDKQSANDDDDDDDGDTTDYDKNTEDDDTGSTTKLKDQTFRGNFDNDADRETAYDDDDGLDYSEGYCVNRIIAGIFVNNKIVGNSVVMYDNVDAKLGKYDELFDNMHDVLWFISQKVGLNFSEKEFTVKFDDSDDIKVGDKVIRATPPILASTTITSKLVQGNKVLNRVFGPEGRYAGYLFNDDGTPRLEPNDAAVDGMTDAEKDVSVVEKYPMLQVVTFVQKIVHDEKDSEKVVKEEITAKDFKGTRAIIER